MSQGEASDWPTLARPRQAARNGEDEYLVLLASWLLTTPTNNDCKKEVRMQSGQNVRAHTRLLQARPSHRSLQQIVLRMKTKLLDDLGLKDLLPPLPHPSRLQHNFTSPSCILPEHSVSFAPRPWYVWNPLSRTLFPYLAATHPLNSEKRLPQTWLRACVTSSLCTACSFRALKKYTRGFSAVSAAANVAAGS